MNSKDYFGIKYNKYIIEILQENDDNLNTEAIFTDKIYSIQNNGKKNLRIIMITS